MLIFLIFSLPFFSSTHDGLTDEEKESLLEKEEELKDFSILMRQKTKDNCKKAQEDEYNDYHRKLASFEKACHDSQEPDVVHAREELEDKQKAVDTIINNLQNTQTYRENLGRYQRTLETIRTTLSDLEKELFIMRRGKKVSMCSELSYQVWRRGGVSSLTYGLVDETTGKERRVMYDPMCNGMTGDTAKTCESVKNKCLGAISKRDIIRHRWNNNYEHSMMRELREGVRTFRSHFFVVCATQSRKPEVVNAFNKLSRNCMGAAELYQYIRELLDIKKHSHTTGSSERTTSASSPTRGTR